MFRKMFLWSTLVSGFLLTQATVSAQEFPIAAGSDTTFSGGAVYGGLNGIVAVQGDSSSQYHIMAQLLGGPGQLIGPRISLGASGVPPGAVPAFDGTNYFLVWLEFSGTVKGQFINTSGGLVGTAVTIASSVSFEHFPYGVVFADSTYLALFVKTDGYLYGQRVTKAGSLLGNQFQISSNFARDFSVAYDGTNFLVAWVEVIPDTDKDIFGQFVSTSGSLVGSNFVIDNGPNYSDNGTSLAFDGTRYLLGFHESPSTNSKWTLLGRFITTTGTIQETITICDSSKAPNTAIVATDGNQYLITWMQGSNGSIMARFYDKSGTPVDTPFVVMGPLGNKVPFGGVGFGGGAYLVVATRVDSNFTDGDVYGKFIMPLTGVEVRHVGIPGHYTLLQNYPNPFNPSTEIQFSVAATSSTSLTLYTILGQKVATLFEGMARQGRVYSVHLDASGLATGAYFYRLQSGDFVATRKLVLLK